MYGFGALLLVVCACFALALVMFVLLHVLCLPARLCPVTKINIDLYDWLHVLRSRSLFAFCLNYEHAVMNILCSQNVQLRNVFH